MKRAVRGLGWMAGAVLLIGWWAGMDTWEALSFQRIPAYRNASGAFLLSLILFQWGLSLGRAVFQKTGSRWGRWVNWHVRISLILPWALLAHSISLGWGLLALLPLSLLAGSHFGTLLDGPRSLRRFLAYHVGFSALTLALALVHLYSVVMYR
ncbi:MAG: hypothetical protein ACPF8Y_05685 [Flavobacteriales bacterium]